MSTISATPTLLHVNLLAGAAKLVMRSRKDQALVDFFPTLPGARWVGSDLAWTCDATPAAAWRVCNHAPATIEASDEVLALSTIFARSLQDPTSSEQPAKRKVNLWRHQLEAYHFADRREAAMLAMGMGTGKSHVAVSLIVNKGAMQTLVLCPVSVRGVWRREFEKWASIQVNVLVLENGNGKSKVKQAETFLAKSRVEDVPAVVVVNYETARMDPFATWSIKRDWDCVVLDESHRAKGATTETGKYVGLLSKKAKFRLALSGTPMAHCPLDLFSQFRFLDRGLFGSSFHHFRNRYAKMNPMFPGKVDAWLNQDELKDRFALLAYRVGNEVLDLPPVSHHERRCKLSEEAQYVYSGLEEDLIADLGTGVVTAANALVRLLRLQQVTSGFTVADDSEENVWLDDAKAKLLAEILIDLPDTEPVVVFCRFRHDLDTVKKLTETLGRRYGELSGRSKDGLTPMATMSPGVDVLGVQIQSGGTGIDLTRAHYGVYYSLGFSLAEFDQSIARLHRPGQERPTHYYHLIASGTVDDAVYGALEQRREIVEAVLEALKR